MSLRILIADDDRLMRTLVAMCLQDIAEIRQAGDGAEALSALKKADLDLLLLDWDMPAPDGLAVLKIVRSQGYNMPIIMVTGEASKLRVIEAIQAGATDYLVKPFEPAALREKVTKYCKPIAAEPVTT